jgi:hypothetical protein
MAHKSRVRGLVAFLRESLLQNRTQVLASSPSKALLFFWIACAQAFVIENARGVALTLKSYGPQLADTVLMPVLSKWCGKN